jgi:ribosome-binding ATPase YchF (GTP1/OBG family)
LENIKCNAEDDRFSKEDIEILQKELISYMRDVTVKPFEEIEKLKTEVKEWQHNYDEAAAKYFRLMEKVNDRLLDTVYYMSRHDCGDY